MSASPLTVVVPLPPSYRGGTERYAYSLVERYGRRAPVRVCTTTVRWDPTAASLDTGPAEVHRMRATELFERPVVLSPTERRGLERAVRSAGLLQLHMPFPGIERLAVRTAHRAGVSTVLTYHMDADLAGVHPSLWSRTMTGLYRAISAHPTIEEADAVVANSLGYAQASPVLSRHLQKVRVIPKGVDAASLGLVSGRRSRQRPPCVPVDAVPPGRRVLLFAGRLVPYKGIPVLLEAVSSLRREGRDVVLLVAGRGPEAARLRDQTAALGLGEFVRFLGFVPDSELGDLYRFADVVTVPSISSLEATATVLEEAVACGTPVVGTSLPGTAETVPTDGRRGLLAPPGDPAALTLAVGRILDHDRPAPPERVRTWDDVAEDYWSLFQELGGRSQIAPGARGQPEAWHRRATPPVWGDASLLRPRASAQTLRASRARSRGAPRSWSSRIADAQE